tara:strand:+ start:2736 stop:3497 length:762 start_codon:yes stop_codon:yes gene_type:complete
MRKKNKKINAAIIIIGNEILSGRTVDQNVSYLASWLNSSVGIKLEEVRIIPDVQSIIVKTVLSLSKTYNYVFTTGGIGPTHDDITSKSISRAFKKKYSYNRDAYKILKKYYGKKDFNGPRKKMAKMPEGSKLIYNPSSAAPGFMIKNVLCLPGVPSILKSMSVNIKKLLKPGTKLFNNTITVSTVESHIAKPIEKVQKKYKTAVEIGSYPFFRQGKVGVSIVMRGERIKKLQSCHNDIIKILRKKNLKIYRGN